MTWRPSRSTIALSAACATLLAVGGCGSEHPIVQIQGLPNAAIDRATLDHWMRSMAGGDFRHSIGAEGPAGLVSEPADYRRCFAAAKLVGPRSFFNQLRRTHVQLEATCHELHSAVKAQALGYLISARWLIAEDAGQGVTVSDATLRRTFNRQRSRFYPTERDLHSYLAERHWSLADLLYRLKAEIMASRLQPQVAGQFSELGNGERVDAMLALKRSRELTSKTKCSPGYVVPNCSGYHGSPASPPAPDVILRALVGKGDEGARANRRVARHAAANP